MSINSSTVLKRFVESIYLNTSPRIEVVSSYEASMEPSISTLIRHKAGQEGRGEILLENSFMR